MLVPVLLASPGLERGRDDDPSPTLPKQSLLLTPGFDSNQTPATIGRHRSRGISSQLAVPSVLASSSEEVTSSS